MDIGTNYMEKQERNVDDATLRVGQHIMGLQRGTSKCASPSGMMPCGMKDTYVYLCKDHVLPPIGHSTICLQRATVNVRNIQTCKDFL